jgi:hypothetical protein
MIIKPAFVWLMLAAASATMLYVTSQRVTDGQELLARMQKSMRQEEESERVLMAEWSYLNKSDRLEKLAQSHLGLQPLRARQFLKESQIDSLNAAAPAAGEKSQEKPTTQEKPQNSTALQPQPRPAKNAPPTEKKRSFDDVIRKLGTP